MTMYENIEYHDNKSLKSLYFEGYECGHAIRSLVYGYENSTKVRKPKTNRSRSNDNREYYIKRKENRANDNHRYCSQYGKLGEKRGLLPLLRSGKRVVFLARDASILGEIFDKPIAWGLNRVSCGKSWFRDLVEQQINDNDVVVDTGWAGSIPRAISKYRNIESVLLSGEGSSFADIVVSNYSDDNGDELRNHLVSFEHSPKIQENIEDGFTVSVLDRECIKRAKAYRLGFKAGLFGLNRAIEIVKARRERIRRYKRDMEKRIYEYRQTQEKLKILETRIKYQNYVIVDHSYTYETDGTSSRVYRIYKTSPLNNDHFRDLALGYSFIKPIRKDLAERLVHAKNMRAKIEKHYKNLDSRAKQLKQMNDYEWLESFGKAQATIINWS